MRYPEDFLQQKREGNKRGYRILCLFVLVAESCMVAVYFLSKQPGLPGLPPVYLCFYTCAVLLCLCFFLLERLLRRWRRAYAALQLSVLSVLLLWAILLSVCDLRHGNSGGAYSQLLIFSSVMLWLPKPLHYGINGCTWLLFLLLAWAGGVKGRPFFDAALNNALLLGIACIVIHMAQRFQYATFCAVREQARIQHARLDLMAEQMERMQAQMEEIRIMRHDLRHYALAVEQDLDLGRYESIRARTARIRAGLDKAAATSRFQTYTGVPEVDAILARYAGWAVSVGARFQVALPRGASPLESHDFSLLLMNALENAAAAISGQELGQPRFLQVRGDDHGNQYFLEISNSCGQGLCLEKENGLPVSRQAGHGYGVKSMAVILKKYGADYRFQTDEARFSFQCLIPARGSEAAPAGHGGSSSAL